MKYFTLIGNHDFINKGSPGLGAALTIFLHYKDEIDGVYIFTSPDKPNAAYKQMSEKIKRRMLQEKGNMPVSVIEMDLDNPVNFDLVYSVMLDETTKVIEGDGIEDDPKIINITSGTPTMSTCWVLLQKSNLIPNAKLIQSFEPYFQRVHGKTCQEVILDIENFPEISTPSEVKRALNRVTQEVKVLKEQKVVKDLDSSFPGLIGKSKSLRDIKQQILKLIDSKTHVLILGEPGTGKEVIAKSIWNTHRKEMDKAQVTYDCGAISPELIISELFGYEKGAFTGANTTKDGLIEKNNGKMLFLDEIGNIPREKQNVFMRLLQFGECKKVGSSTVNNVDVQIIAATNKNINDQEMFASDLRDRFDEIIILPPLRDRKDDIKELVDYFLQMEDKNISFTNNIYDELYKYPWPGNVRQLQKWVSRICRFFEDTQLEWSDIPDNIKPDLPSHIDEELDFPNYPIDYNHYTDQLRLRAIDIAKGNMSEADRLLGLKDGTMKQWKFQREKRLK